MCRSVPAWNSEKCVHDSIQNNRAKMAIIHNLTFASNKSLGHPTPTLRICLLPCSNLLTSIYSLTWFQNWKMPSLFHPVCNRCKMVSIIDDLIVSLSIWLGVVQLFGKGLFNAASSVQHARDRILLTRALHHTINNSEFDCLLLQIFTVFRWILMNLSRLLSVSPPVTVRPLCSRMARRALARSQSVTYPTSTRWSSTFWRSVEWGSARNRARPGSACWWDTQCSGAWGCPRTSWSTSSASPRTGQSLERTSLISRKPCK